MSELEYDKNWASELTAAGFTPSSDPVNLRGVLKQILAGLTITVTTPTLGAAAQLAQLTQKVQVLLDVTTAGNLVVAVGPTSGVANTVFSGTSPIQLLNVPLPAAWYIAVTTSNTAVWSATVFNGM